ncbi:MAG: polysaccharide deacetylase [Eubacterium sp.]|nr:polysaccharide deacetylase [Eubacterium sp.]
MNDKNEGLNDRLARKKRVQRMKTGLVWFLLTWLLAQTLISLTLIAKVHSLQEQIDIITENTIRSQQVEQKENQSQKSGGAYGAVTGKDSKDRGNAASASAGVAGVRLAAKDSDDKAQLESDAHGVQKAEKNKESQEERRVYLTFDDGPSKNTKKILRVLDKYHIKATFFLTGREDEQSLELYREIAQRGHSIGMHSYTHKYEEIYDSVEAFEEDLTRIQNRIQEAAGVECSLYRFPGGSSNQVSKLEMQEFIKVLKEKEITYFDWNVECGDATYHDYTVKELVDNVMQDVVKYRTSVVLMHDAENKTNTVKALSVIIEKLLAMDAQILPIDENTRLVQHISVESVED